MTQVKISALSELTQIATGDYLPILDVSDNSQGSNGSVKKIKVSNVTNYFEIVKATGTSDNALINAAILRANAAGGGTIFLPDSLYTISSFVDIKSNVILAGAGYNTTVIKKVNSGNFSAITNSSSISNFIIRDLKIDGNKTNSALGRGLSLNAALSGVVERIQVVDAVEGIFNTGCTDLIIEKCISDSNYEWNFYTYAGTRVKMLYNRSLNAKQGNFEGFGMAFYNNNAYCEAIGNYIYNSANNGLQVNAGSATIDVLGVTLRDNFIESAGNRGIFVTNDNASFKVKRISVVGNRVLSAHDNGIYIINTQDSIIEGNKSTSALQSGIIVETSTNCIIKGNNSLSNSKYGINCQGVTNCVISSNNCQGNGFKGIMLQQQSSTQSTGCVVIGNRTTGNTQGGIWTLNTANANLFVGNNVAGNNTANMSIIADSTSIIRHNIGYVTESSGTASIASGATSVVVTHGLGTTPAAKDISLTITANPTNDPGNLYVDTITSTQFTIHSRNDPGASNLGLAWRAVIL